MKIYILARKNLEYTSRVHKQAKALADAGHDVTVVGMKVGSQADHERRDGYTIIRLQLRPLHNRLVIRLASLRDQLMQRVFSPTDKTGDQNRFPQSREQGAAVTTLFGSIKGAPAQMFRMYLKGISWTVNKILRLLVVPVRNLLTMNFTWSCWQLLKDQPAHVIQAHDSYTLPAAYALARRHLARLVYDAVEIVTDRNLEKKRRVSAWMAYRLEKFFIPRLHLVLTPSSSKAELLAKRYRISSPEVILHCCPYQPPLDSLSAQPLLGNISRGRRIALYSGGITHNRGLEQLVQCVPHLPEDMLVVIMGPVTRAGYREQLMELIVSLDAEGKVFLLPAVPHAQVVDYTASADVVVVPIQYTLSHYLSIPNKIFEAIMARVPIAASDFPGIHSIVFESKIGCLFDEKDPKDIARAIRDILQPEVYPAMKANLELAAQKYSWEHEAEKLIAAYQVLENGKKSESRIASPGGQLL